MDFKPVTAPATWDKLQKQFKKWDAKEERLELAAIKQGRKPERRIQAWAVGREDFDASLDYTIVGGDEWIREKCMSAVMDFGQALGCPSGEAITGCLKYVIGDTIRHQSKLWRPLRESFRLPALTPKPYQVDASRTKTDYEWQFVPAAIIPITVQGAGELDLFCRAAARSCARLKRQAMAVEAQATTAQAALASVGEARRSRKKKARKSKAGLSGKRRQRQAQKLPKFRSELRTVIALVLLSQPAASDQKVCSLVDDKPRVDFPAGWKDEKGTRFESLESVYENPDCRHRVETEISTVRRVLRKHGLLKG